MATVKIKLRISKTKIDDGVIYYQICHQQKTIHITTNMHISSSLFESLTQARTIFDVEPPLRELKTKIDHDLSQLSAVIASLETRQEPYRISEIKETFLELSNSVSFINYMEEIIRSLKANGKFGSASNYASALRSFSSFLQLKNVRLDDIDSSLIFQYNEWLASKRICMNSISFYMRILRAVYNRAVKQSLVKQKYPFREVYTGVDKTRKRAIAEEDLYKMIQLNLKDFPSLDLARDLFLFSFCTRGMSFVDISFLKRENVSNGAISYRRKKTGQLLSVKIEPCIERILSKYIAVTAESPYIFPIVQSSDVSENYKRYHIALTDYNRNLKKLAKMADIDIDISSYSARHTWATIAHYHNVPLPVISEGMGHTSESTTKIYLASLHNSVIDQANSSLLEHLNKLISL